MPRDPSGRVLAMPLATAGQHVASWYFACGGRDTLEAVDETASPFAAECQRQLGGDRDYYKYYRRKCQLLY